MTTQSAETTTTRTLDPEVQPASVRPSWTAAQKLALLAEYEAFPHGSAERGAFLRRNGLYTSHMSKWRRLRDQGSLAGLAPQARGPKPAPLSPLVAENARLQDELARVQARLTQAEAVIEIPRNLPGRDVNRQLRRAAGQAG